jgi:hypothetical protein
MKDKAEGSEGSEGFTGEHANANKNNDAEILDNSFEFDKYINKFLIMLK